MGMFDDITYTAPCPLCGTALTAWQSKDARCTLEKLAPQELWNQKRNDGEIKFYDNCENCGTWVEIHINRGVLPFTSDDYAKIAKGQRVHHRRGPITEDQ